MKSMQHDLAVTPHDNICLNSGIQFRRPSKMQMHHKASIGENDVLLGRGGTICKHPGNEKLRKMVRSYSNAYMMACRKEKPQIASILVDAIHGLVPPGRFLKHDAATGEWHEVSDSIAREKVSQSLRNTVLHMQQDKHVPELKSVGCKSYRQHKNILLTADEAGQHDQVIQIFEAHGQQAKQFTDFVATKPADTCLLAESNTDSPRMVVKHKPQIVLEAFQQKQESEPQREGLEWQNAKPTFCSGEFSNVSRYLVPSEFGQTSVAAAPPTHPNVCLDLDGAHGEPVTRQTSLWNNSPCSPYARILYDGNGDCGSVTSIPLENALPRNNSGSFDETTLYQQQRDELHILLGSNMKSDVQASPYSRVASLASHQSDPVYHGELRQDPNNAFVDSEMVSLLQHLEVVESPDHVSNDNAFQIFSDPEFDALLRTLRTDAVILIDAAHREECHFDSTNSDTPTHARDDTEALVSLEWTNKEETQEYDSFLDTSIALTSDEREPDSLLPGPMDSSSTSCPMMLSMEDFWAWEMEFGTVDID